MSSKLRPLSTLKVLSHQIPAHGLTPNTSIQHKPLLIYKAAFAPDVTAAELERHLKGVGVVVPRWRYSMYSTSHFHVGGFDWGLDGVWEAGTGWHMLSTSHEVLAISHGRALLCFGHEENPDAVRSTVTRGDVIVVPAGVAHRLLEDLDGGLEMVGCYPKECDWDMCYGRAGEEGKVKGIEGLGWFGRDPVFGEEGPVLGA